MSDSILTVRDELRSLGYDAFEFDWQNGKVVAFPYTIEAGSKAGHTSVCGDKLPGGGVPRVPPSLGSRVSADTRPPRWRAGIPHRRRQGVARHESCTRFGMGPIAQEGYGLIHRRTPAADMEARMRYEAAFTHEASSTALGHLLQHFRQDTQQEDLCFGLWRPSTGQRRLTALIYQIILPEPGERSLHGNTSFNSEYMGRAVAEARKQGAGLAFMHSHPNPGWQPLSRADWRAEQDVIAYPAGATKLPLVGLTVGNDGTWSARFWSRTDGRMRLKWCDKVRTLAPKSYSLSFNDTALPPQPKREMLKRTYDSWGQKTRTPFHGCTSE